MKAEMIDLGGKNFMNPREARAYWNLSGRKFYKFLDEGPHSFLAFYGKRKLIIREEFEVFLQENPLIKEALKNGKPHTKRLEA